MAFILFPFHWLELRQTGNHNRNWETTFQKWLCIVEGTQGSVDFQPSLLIYVSMSEASGLSSSANGKGPTWQCRRLKRHGFSPWVRKIPSRRKWQPTSLLLPGESHGQRSLVSTVHRVAKSQTWLKRLSTYHICLRLRGYASYQFFQFTLLELTKLDE